MVATDLAHADSLRERARYWDAIAAYEVASNDLEADIAYLFHMIGICYARLADHDAAIANYTIALYAYDEQQNRSGYVHCLRDRADSYAAQGEYNLARDDLNLAIEAHDPTNRDEQAEIRHYLGRLERRLGDIDQENRHLRTAMGLSQQGYARDDRLYLYLDFASLLIRSERPGKARLVAASALVLAIRKRAVPHVVRALLLIVFAGRPEAEKVQRALYGRAQRS